MNTSVDFNLRYPILTALALALGSAISLGISRFSYALFLPLMRADLHWSYFTAGNMNTANAIGYLIGALSCGWLFKYFKLSHIFLIGTFFTILLIALPGLFISDPLFFMVRLLVGYTSAMVFVGGGVLATQLAAEHPKQSGIILGIFYGGVGLGIMLSSPIVYFVEQLGQEAHIGHPWQWAWLVLGGLALILAFIMYVPTSQLNSPKNHNGQTQKLSLYPSLWMIVGYFLYGLGYIGYMTFVVALLRQMGISLVVVNIFYAVLGFAIMCSSRIWAKPLDRYHGGQTLTMVNLMMSMGCLIPTAIALSIEDGQVTSIQVALIFISALTFGSSFLTAVSSTTAFVKHNYEPTQWVFGIRVFTITFALGQIIGPILIGYISDYGGGLAIGLLISGVILLLGSITAWKQKPLHAAA
jgi:predicted MFS family arabinose efflux permease